LPMASLVNVSMRRIGKKWLSSVLLLPMRRRPGRQKRRRAVVEELCKNRKGETLYIDLSKNIRTPPVRKRPPVHM
jgi:hypothetical protein